MNVGFGQVTMHHSVELTEAKRASIDDVDMAPCKSKRIRFYE